MLKKSSIFACALLVLFALTSVFQAGANPQVQPKPRVADKTVLEELAQMRLRIKALETQGRIPAGTVVAFAGSNVPYGWFPCDGRALSSKKYPNLFKAIRQLYRRDIRGQFFQIPDYRGMFLRGLDAGKNVDKNRTLGSFQESSLLRHRHQGQTRSRGAHVHKGRTGDPIKRRVRIVHQAGPQVQQLHHSVGWKQGGGSRVHAHTFPTPGHAHFFSTNRSVDHVHPFETTHTGGGESRPKNIAVHYIIKW